MTTDATVHDPVCHMDIDIKDAAGRSDYMDKTYYFCARGCQLEFEENPEAVLKAEAEYDHGQPAGHGMTMRETDSPAGSGGSRGERWCPISCCGGGRPRRRRG